MFKFLRKYNKFILAVGGTLLLVVFLIPQAITRLSQRAASIGATVATYDDGEKVSSQQWAQAQQEVLFLQQNGRQFGSLGTISDPEHWFLLVREAEQAGLLGLSPLSQATPEQLQATARQGGVNVAFAERALTRVFAVNQMLQLFVNAGKVSDRRLRAQAERLLHQVQATMVVIEASGEGNDTTFTDEQMNAQFQQYADVLPGEGEKGFGYKLPDRVKLEWMSIPHQSIKRLVESDEEALDGITLRRHWRENENVDGLPPVDSTGPIPPAVREHLVNRLTGEKTDEIAKWASGLLQAPRRGFVQRAGYLELPEDWESRQLSFQTLAEKLRERYAGLELPGYQSSGDHWMTTEELDDLPDIGQASTDKFGTPADLSQLVATAREFGGSTTQFVQEDVAAPPLSGTDGSLYFFRIIATDPSREPNSLDEVRDQVLADLRRVAQYDQLKSNQNEILSQAQTQGLLAVAMSYDTIVQFRTQVTLCSVFSQQLFPFSNPLPVIGQDEEASGKIIDFALGLPRNQAASDLPLAQRTLALPLDDKLVLLIVRIDDQTPLTEPQYKQYASQLQIQNLIRREELDTGEALVKTFNRDALIARHKFAFTRDSSDTKDEDATETRTAAAETTDASSVPAGN